MKVCMVKGCALEPLCKFKQPSKEMHIQYFAPCHTGEACDAYIPASELNDAYAIPEEQDE